MIACVYTDVYKRQSYKHKLCRFPVLSDAEISVYSVLLIFTFNPNPADFWFSSLNTSTSRCMIWLLSQHRQLKHIFGLFYLILFLADNVVVSTIIKREADNPLPCLTHLLNMYKLFTQHIFILNFGFCESHGHLR